MGEKREITRAAAVWCGLMLSYLASGLLQLLWPGLPFVIVVNILFTILCFALVKGKGEGRETLGFDRGRLVPSCLAGLAWSAVIVAVNGIIPGILRGGELSPLGSIVPNLVYFMALISFPEEVIFRGYLLGRLESVMEGKYGAVILSGVLFMLLHIPYQAVVSGNFLELLLNGYGMTLVMTFVWHIVFCILLKKTGAIYGAVLFHGIMDWSNGLFL